MSSLQQLNVRFEALDDRLVLSVRTNDDSEYSLWLTRRFTKLLLNLLESVVSEGAGSGVPAGGGDEAVSADSSDAGRAPDLESAREAPAQEAVKAFERESALAKVDFSTEYQATAVNHPLGEEPLLASRIDYRSLENDTLSLTLGVSEAQGVNLVLDRDLQYAVIKLLTDGAVTAEWNLDPSKATDSQPVTFNVSDTVLH